MSKENKVTVGELVKSMTQAEMEDTILEIMAEATTEVVMNHKPNHFIVDNIHAYHLATIMEECGYLDRPHRTLPRIWANRDCAAFPMPWTVKESPSTKGAAIKRYRVESADGSVVADELTPIDATNVVVRANRLKKKGK